jgi:tetratricopeptide (TPR) repeat protein
MSGDYANARRYAAEDVEILNELGLTTTAEGMRTLHALIEINAGEMTAAIDMLTQAQASLRGIGDVWFAEGVSALLAYVLARSGDRAAARGIARELDHARSSDAVAAIWRSEANALIALGDEDLPAALSASREAILLASDTDHLAEQARAHIIHAEVSAQSTRSEDAIQSAERALTLHSLKRNRVGTLDARALIRRLTKA